MICNRYRAVALLLGEDPGLVRFIFDEQLRTLAASPRALSREAELIGWKASVQVDIALDIWCGSRRTRLIDVLRALDAARYDCFTAALEYYVASGAGGCRCKDCLQRRPRIVDLP